ncbi:MAG: hypothetical protein JWQ29_1603 [Phenylobacterium sp.]|nr:hypothetical protein [Phenylobacterium sp.]
MRAFVMASALAFVLAGPASAATFVFDVTLTDIPASSGAFGGGTPVTRYETQAVPFTFQVSYEIGPITNVSIPAPGGGGYSGDAVATTTPQPFEADFLAATGFSAGQITRSMRVLENTDGIGVTVVSFGMASPLIDTGSEYAQVSAGFFGYRFGAPVGPLGGFTPQKIDVMFRSLSNLTYEGQGVHWVLNEAGDDFAVADLAWYRGTATYRSDLSVVPEPATWALMIGGFGLTGAALRRRLSVAVAA